MSASPIKSEEAIARHQVNKKVKPKAFYEDILKAEPNHADALHCLGIVEYQANNLQRALELMSRAIEVNPTNADFYVSRGNVLHVLKELEAAVDNYDRAIKLNPDYATAYFARGFVLQELEQFEAAVLNYDYCINLKPDDFEAYFNRGFALQKLKQFESAVLNYDHCITLKPDDFEAYFNRANALRELQRLEESAQSFDLAIALNPDCAEAYFNRGLVLHELKFLEKAIASYDQALAINPGNAEIYWSKSLALLSKPLSLSANDLEEGWELYEWRSKRENTKFQILEITNKWDGKKTDGSLLVLSEQGLGDKIFYAGMLNDVQSITDDITVCVEPRLIPLYKRSFENIKLVSIISPALVPSFDAQIYMPSLGFYFRSNLQALQNVKTPYLKACPDKTKKMRSRLSGDKKLICGLSWISTNLISGHEKSLTLQQLKSILTLDDIEFVDLQYGDTREEQTAFYEDSGVRLTQTPDVDKFKNIDDLASLIDACDLVLTVSNITAHLAGALGKNVFIMLPFKPFPWYWHEVNGISPWYPTARLFRQERSGDWESVKTKIKRALENEVDKIHSLSRKK